MQNIPKYILGILLMSTLSLASEVIQTPNNVGIWEGLWGQEPINEIMATNEKVIIRGADASIKRNVTEQILNWLDKSELTKNLNYDYTIDLTGAVKSSFATKGLQLGRFYSTHGVNCHGTSLILSGYLNHETHVSPEEMGFFLENYCVRVNSPKSGDIGVQKERFGGNIIPFHSFTVIGDNAIIQKKSVQKFHPITMYYMTQLPANKEYYRCDSDFSYACKSSYINEKKQLKDLDQMINSIMANGQDIKRRAAALKSLEDLKEQLVIMKRTDRSICKIDLDRMEQRVLSLIEASESMQGMSYYREKDGLVFIQPKI